MNISFYLVESSLLFVGFWNVIVWEKKGRGLTQSYDKSPYTNINVKKAKWQHKQRHKKFDYTAVADRLRTVSWSNYGHATGVVFQFYRAHLTTHRNSCVIQDKNMQILLYSDIKVAYI